MPYRFGAVVTGVPLPSPFILGQRYNAFIGETFSRKTSIPDGYAARGAYTLPVKAGGLSSWQSTIALSGGGDLLQGGPMVGTATLSFVTDNADTSLVVSLSGTGSASFVGSGGLALTIGLSGDAGISITGGAGLSMIVPIEAGGSFGFTGFGNLKGQLSMDGSWGGVTPLSPEGLADAVWAKTNVNGVPYGTVVTSGEKNAKLAAALSA
jgi:hypothetical protein